MEDERNWIMLAAAALAGGAGAKEATERADKVSAAAKSRFNKDEAEPE